MVHIKKVEIHGFKSFGFTNKIINLDEGLVCITGPNGSGKSNILDAIAFGLGENSPKTLRVDRLHSLIHDNQNARSKRIRVSITFDNNDRGIPIDSNIVTITRELPWNGESNYLLNGKHVSKSTITDLLEVVLATPNKLNNVQQGMIMRIAELNSEERRKILEDIIGLSYFDSKKEEAMKQLVEADRKLEVALARMGEIRKRIEELELERNNQIRFHYLEQQIEKLNAIRISNTIKRHKEKMNELKVWIEERDKESEKFRGELAEVRGELSKLEEERDAIMREVDKSTKSKAEINTKISNLIVKLEELKAVKDGSEKRIKVIGSTIPSLIKEKEKLKKEWRKGSREIEELEKESERLNNEKEALANKIKELNKGLDALNKALNEMNSKENMLTSMLRTKEEELSGLKAKIAEDSERLKIVEGNLDSNITRLEGSREEISKLESLVKELEGIREKKDLERKKIVGEIDKLSKRKERLSQYIEEAMSILEQAMKITTKYDARINASKEVNSEEYAMAMLLKDRDDKIIGVVKDLIEYDKRYAKAIIAVGSEWLNAIVVNSINDALTIVEKAKAMNLQRVKVIPLEMINRLEFEKGRLSEIIKTNYKKLVDFIFDAYLTDSPLEARKIAEEGHNAVTLDGERFSANITSIGLSKVERLKDLTKMILLTKSIDELKDVLTKLDEIIMVKKEQLKSIENRLEENKSKKIEIEGILNKTDMELGNIKEQLVKYKNNLINIRKKADENQLTRERLWEEIRTIGNKQSKVLESINKIKDELASINKDDYIKKIDEINSSKASLVSQLDEKENSHRKTLTQLSSKRVEYRNASKRLEDMERELISLKKETKERKAMIEKAANTISELEKELREARDMEQKIIDTSANSVTLLKEHDEKIKGLNERERRLVKQLTSIERDLVISKKEMDDLVINTSKLRGELINMRYEEDDDINVEPILKELTKEYDSIKHTVNQLADKSYKQLIDGYRGMSERRNQLEEERNSIVKFIEGIDNEKKKIFMESFEKIDKDVRHIFATMTDNLGSAWLEIEDPENVFDSRLSLMIQFPNKPSRESTSLSGGEKTIAAITFLLALQSLKPSPYYLFDEVDAHLDAQNTERLLKILLERSKVSQMIVVTLKDMIVAHANLVYGVYARNGVSNVIKYRSKVEILE